MNCCKKSILRNTKGGKGMEKITLSVNELAHTLGIGRSTAYELVNTPGFPSANVGKRIVVPVAALNEWLARGGTQKKADGLAG